MQNVFEHTHPYVPFIDDTTLKLIVGTLPPPRFTTGELKKGYVNFCYGSKNGQLWPILDNIFNLNLKFETTVTAIEQRKTFLKSRGIGVCDIVASAEREKIDASDIGMQIHFYLQEGTARTDPSIFFGKHLKENSVVLKRISNEVPKIHEFTHPSTNKLIKTVSLIAPSGAANRAVGSLESYKRMKKEDPTFNTVDFRVLQYSVYF